jgi:hypothetical protein
MAEINRPPGELGLSSSQFDAAEPPLPEWPVCGQCGWHMRHLWAEPDGRDVQTQVFECSGCYAIERVKMRCRHTLHIAAAA